jgi:hypothetical protein
MKTAPQRLRRRTPSPCRKALAPDPSLPISAWSAYSVIPVLSFLRSLMFPVSYPGPYRQSPKENLRSAITLHPYLLRFIKISLSPFRPLGQRRFKPCASWVVPILRSHRFPPVRNLFIFCSTFSATLATSALPFSSPYRQQF